MASRGAGLYGVFLKAGAKNHMCPGWALDITAYLRGHYRQDGCRRLHCDLPLDRLRGVVHVWH